MRTIYFSARQCYFLQEASQKILSFQINYMMDYAAISSNKFKKNLHIFDVREAIQELVDIMKPQAVSVGNEVFVNFMDF